MEHGLLPPSPFGKRKIAILRTNKTDTKYNCNLNKWLMVIIILQRKFNNF